MDKLHISSFEFPSAVIRRALKMKDRGMSATQIQRALCAVCDVVPHRSTIIYWTPEYLRKKQRKEALTAKAVAMYEAGMSGSEIAAELRIPLSTVYWMLRTSGVEMRSDYNYERRAA